MCSVFFWQIDRKQCTFQKWFYNWSCTFSKVVEQFSVISFFDSCAKARLIHLDSFLKADFLRFFRKVKVNLLSKNGFKIGLEYLVDAVFGFASFFEQKSDQ